VLFSVKGHRNFGYWCLFSVHGSLKCIGYEIPCSVNSFTENSDKYSNLGEAFTEMLGSRFYFQ